MNEIARINSAMQMQITESYNRKSPAWGQIAFGFEPHLVNNYRTY